MKKKLNFTDPVRILCKLALIFPLNLSVFPPEVTVWRRQLGSGRRQLTRLFLLTCLFIYIYPSDTDTTWFIYLLTFMYSFINLIKYVSKSDFSLWRHEPRVDRQRVAAQFRTTSVPQLLHGVPGGCAHVGPPHQERPEGAPKDGGQLPQVRLFVTKKKEKLPVLNFEMLESSNVFGFFFFQNPCFQMTEQVYSMGSCVWRSSTTTGRNWRDAGSTASMK